MGYSTIAVMARDSFLRERFIGCAAQELGATDPAADPQAWVVDNIWALVSAPGLADSYQFAEDNKTVNVNPETGARTDVIDDATILATVQARIAALAA